MKSSLNGGPIKNRVFRVLCALVGIVVALGLIAGLVLVALPLVIGAVVVGGLAAVLFPRLRRRRSPQSGQLPRQPGKMQRVEPMAPPRTLERTEESGP
ncbi:MAG: hypothetical protein QNL51_09145 [Opitutaceae bacterium]